MNFTKIIDLSPSDDFFEIDNSEPKKNHERNDSELLIDKFINSDNSTEF